MNRMERVASVCAALADLNRLRLLNLMRDGEVCVCYLHGALKANQPRVSRHLAYLRRAGMVAAERRGKWQYYRLSVIAEPLQRIVDAALAAVESDPQFRKDRQRVKQICCSPSRFGLPEPILPSLAVLS
jgi:ArsR family transcriptional regulator